MKAYEIKVTIKNSKPPIWRKIIVPAGINFMQFHNIIQVAFEWLNYHMYEFSFKELAETITNNKESCEEYAYYMSEEGKRSFKDLVGFTPHHNAVLYAKDVTIDKYFEMVKRVTYVYDFGDWWEHTIEILNCIDNYEYDYPQITKFKQVSPPDDCGGIYGYYEFLEQYLDKSNPEQQSIAEWAHGQGYHDEYDIDTINEEMEEILDLDLDDFDEFW